MQGAAATHGQGFVAFVFYTFLTPDITSFGPAGQASKFPVMESSLLS